MPEHQLELPLGLDNLFSKETESQTMLEILREPELQTLLETLSETTQELRQIPLLDQEALLMLELE